MRFLLTFVNLAKNGRKKFINSCNHFICFLPWCEECLLANKRYFEAVDITRYESKKCTTLSRQVFSHYKDNFTLYLGTLLRLFLSF
jgi:hypothetical protein